MQHTHQVVFGRKVGGCPRCMELRQGAKPVQWRGRAAQDEARHLAEVRAHDCKTARCAVVCTFGEW